MAADGESIERVQRAGPPLESRGRRRSFVLEVLERSFVHPEGNIEIPITVHVDEGRVGLFTQIERVEGIRTASPLHKGRTGGPARVLEEAHLAVGRIIPDAPSHPDEQIQVAVIVDVHESGVGLIVTGVDEPDRVTGTGNLGEHDARPAQG